MSAENLVKSAPGSFQFGDFTLDPADRQLRRDGAPVAVSSRYLDALILLVREEGRLVTKARFMDEVWDGTPVTDEALTQCIRTLRRLLGDDAARPRFIATEPRHGYRFVAPVAWRDGDAARPLPAAASDRPDGRIRRLLHMAAWGAAGGGAAGALGGLLYGLVAAAPAQSDGGAVSALLVLICLTSVVGVLGGAGVALGLAAIGASSVRQGPMAVLGGAAGGLVVGGAVKLLGLDAFNLLFGRAPGDITGAPEGAMLGAAVGLGVWLSDGSPRRGALAGSLAGAVAGAAIALAGGRLLGGSLELLARGFPGSGLQLQRIGALLSEDAFGPAAQALSAAVEGGLFSAAVAAALVLAGAAATPTAQPPRQAGAAQGGPRRTSA